MKKLLEKFFSKRKEIKFAYLFGSLAKGKNNKLSDIDIAVFVDKKLIYEKKHSYGYKASLITDLMSELNTDKIDLVILNEATPLLAHRVIRDGILIYCKDDRARINFQVRTIHEYIDTEKIRRIQEKYLKERIYSGKFARL